MNPTSLDTTDGVINVDDLLARCMGNADIAQRVLAKFQERFSADLSELEEGLHQANPGAIAQVAHRIKGASANVAAPGLFKIAAAIEQLGRAERISEISPEVQQLRDEWARFVHGVSALQQADWFPGGGAA